MKSLLFITPIAFCLISANLFAQKNIFNKKPLILAAKEHADIKLGGTEWNLERWRISPQIEHDTLTIALYSKQEEVAFRTDKDSIKFNIRAGETKSFYIKLNDAQPAHTLINAKPFQWDIISYEKNNIRKDLKFFYERPSNNYYDSLRHEFPLDEVIKNDHSDTEKILSVLNWTHHQWAHNGNNTPKGSNGLAILKEAREGGQFPCFAYSIVLRDQLSAAGFKARVLYLKTKDAETRKGSPGHVATEVFINDLNKWVFIDGQFNVMPTFNGKPLNAVEFQQVASKNYDKLVLRSKDNISKKDYIDFVYDYLFYYDTALDNRLLAKDALFTLEGKRNLMLVPVGAPNLTRIEFWKSKTDYCVYTHSLKDFYAKPM